MAPLLAAAAESLGMNSSLRQWEPHSLLTIVNIIIYPNDDHIRDSSAGSSMFTIWRTVGLRCSLAVFPQTKVQLNELLKVRATRVRPRKRFAAVGTEPKVDEGIGKAVAYCL